MTDIDTLRREFEAAYADAPDSKHKEYGRDLFVWNEHGNHYRYEYVHNVFKGFCMGRLPAQAEIERLRDIVRQFRIEAHDQQLINDSEYESLAGDGESVARLRVYYDMRIEIERLQSVVYDYRKMMNDFLNHLEVEPVAEIDEIDKPIDSDLRQTVANNYSLRMAEACAIRDNLQAVVDRIPKFADGSPALPGDEAWHPGLGLVGKVCYHHPDVRMIGPGYVQFESGARSRRQSICECYPTREAMGVRT